MKTRILTAIIALPLIIAALLQPYAEIWGGIAFLASIFGLYEFYKATGVLKSKILSCIGFLSALYFSLWWFVPKIAILPFALWFTALLLMTMLIFHKTVTANMVGIVILSALYIPYFLCHIIGLRLLPNGEYYIWLILVCAFMADTFAYFVGKAFGKHKLCPNISPNKTIAGAIGGVIGCGGMCMLFGFIIQKYFGANVDFLRLFILGLICSVAAQLGDLTASVIKRQFKIKDYGNLFPGHGGVLDRCDSIIFVAPIIFYYIMYIGIIK